MIDGNAALHDHLLKPTSAPERAPSSWRREMLELAALFLAVGVAHLLATLLGHRDPGPVVLVGLGAALITGTWIHRRLAAGRSRARLVRRTAPRPSTRARRQRKAEAFQLASPELDGGGTMTLWRIRTRVVERPGRLAKLATAFADLRCNVLGPHIAPLGGSAISPAGCDALDEFVLEAPAELTARVLRSAVETAGGTDTVIVPAQVKDLIDPGVHALLLASGVSEDPRRLPHAMSELLRAASVEWRHPGDTTDHDGELNTTMVVSVHPDGVLLVRRPEMPFTPTEAARAAALADAVRHRRYTTSG